MAICKNDPVQEESWVDIAPLSRIGPPPFPHISLLQQENVTSTWSKTAQFCLLLWDQKEQQHAVLSFLPAPFPAMPGENFRLETPANFKSHHYHTQANFKGICNQIAITLLCTRIFFPDHCWPSRNLENKTKQKNPELYFEVQWPHWESVII